VLLAEFFDHGRVKGIGIVACERADRDDRVLWECALEGCGTGIVSIDFVRGNEDWEIACLEVADDGDIDLSEWVLGRVHDQDDAVDVIEPLDRLDDALGRLFGPGPGLVLVHPVHGHEFFVIYLGGDAWCVDKIHIQAGSAIIDPDVGPAVGSAGLVRDLADAAHNIAGPVAHDPVGKRGLADIRWSIDTDGGVTFAEHALNHFSESDISYTVEESHPWSALHP
jgi:hypothetical protein